MPSMQRIPSFKQDELAYQNLIDKTVLNDFDKNVKTDITTVINNDCSLTNENTSGVFFIMRSQCFQIVLISP